MSDNISLARYVDDLVDMVETMYEGEIETMLGDRNHIMIRFTVNGEVLRLEITKEAAENV